MQFSMLFAGAPERATRYTRIRSSCLPGGRGLMRQLCTILFLGILIVAAPAAWATPPNADPKNATTDEDNSVDITLSGSDPVDGDTIVSFTVSSGPSSGTLSATTVPAGSPTITYTPNANFNGNDSFEYTAFDGTETSAPALVSITVNSINDLPVADDIGAVVLEDGSVGILLSGSDPVEGSPIVGYNVTSGPSNGGLSGTPPNLTYSPDANYNGGDSFQYTVNDGTDNSAPATVTITVNPDNDPPTTTGISNQSATEDQPFSVNVSGSFDDIDGDTLTFSASGLPSSGNLGINASSGLISGTPNQADSEENGGVHVVTVTARDALNVPVNAVFTLTIGGSNDPPVADDQAVFVDEDDSVMITLSGSDPDGDSLTYEIVSGSGPSDGSLGPVVGATVTYTPTADYNGSDSFRFRVFDGTVNSAPATVSITVNPVNDPPTSTPISNQTATEDVSFSLNVSGNFDDVDGDSLTYSATGLPPSLAPINASSGVIDGTPTQEESEINGGVYNVTVTATDPAAAATQQSFTLTVTPQNDVPVADSQDITIDEDMSTPVTLTATDEDGDALTYVVISGPANGSLTGSAPNLTYTPNLNFSGDDSFDFVANDGIVNSAPATVDIRVNPINDPPVLLAPVGSQQAVEMSPFSLDLNNNFSDPDDPNLDWTATGLPVSGNISLNTNTGVISGTAALEDAQDIPYSVTVMATDGEFTATDTFPLTVSALDRANVGLSLTSAPSPAMLDDQVLFSFQINNQGPQAAQDVNLTGSFFGESLTVTPSGATTCTIQPAGGQRTDFTCMIGGLTVGAQTSLSISASTPTAGSITAVATAEGLNPVPIDPFIDNNSAQNAVGVAETFSNGAVQILGSNQVLDIAYGDVNGDGFDDLVLGTMAGQPVQVFLSNGFRNFTGPVSGPDTAAQNGVALADFDNNGTLDMALANAGVADTVYSNNGSGVFTLMATLPSPGPGPTNSNDVAADDFDRDGNMDLLFAASSPNPLYLGDGLGGFTLDSALGDADSRAVAVGQLTGNNRPDAVFANADGNATQWNNIGTSANNSPSRTFNTGATSSVVIAELIGGSDNNAFDVAFGRIPGSIGDIPGNLVFSNNGSGGFSLSRTLGSAPTLDILAGDVDRNGQNDLVFVNDTGVHQIWVRSGNTFDLHSEQIVDDDAVAGVLTDLGDTDVGDPGGVDMALGGNPTPGGALYLNDGLGNLGKGDITPPTLTLNGDDPLEISSGSPFNDPRATATDNIDGDISASVVATGTVNTAVVGDYIVTYNVMDFAGNSAPPITRTVTVVPGTGTGGGGGTVSPYAMALLAMIVAVLTGRRRRYIRSTPIK